MAGERTPLQVQEREGRGSRDARRLRREGLVPGVLYGDGTRSYPICVAERELRRALTGPAGLHTILDVVIDGGKSTHPSVLKSYHEDPIRGTLTHVDLHEVRLDRPIQTQVVVTLVGEAAGSKEGGVLSQVARELDVEALPLEVPERIEADVSEMRIGDTLRLVDLAPITGVRFLDDPEETVLATVTLPTRFVEPEPEEVPEEEAELVEVPEGEEAPEGAAEGPAEPEAGSGAREEGKPGSTPG